MIVRPSPPVPYDLAAVLNRSITVLGSTGTVGVATLDVIAAARRDYGTDVFPIEALTAQSNITRLIEQARALRPRIVVIGDKGHGRALAEALAGTGIATEAGSDAIVDAARRPSDMVMASIVGAAGLAPTLAAVERGAMIALANKECVVAAGALFRRMAQASGAVVIPVDSEHNAAFQLLSFGEIDSVAKVTLTASGGPFRTWTVDRIGAATPEQAVAHPNWRMGAKISVDSASLMNKGLELIEAQLLFGLTPEQLDVVVHPQSLVHCFVTHLDGSILAHLSAPDMRTPIAHALGWPQRISSPARCLDFAELTQMTFEKPDFGRFPCLGLARSCLQIGGAAPTILNAANEVAVDHFLNRRIGFLDIARAVERTLDVLAGDVNAGAPSTLEAVLALDSVARLRAREACGVAAA